MRSDMHKLLCERPRYGGGPVRKERHCDPEERPLKESMTRRHVEGRREKSLNDFLTPLHRYLRKQAGRPWSKVYGEICASGKAGSTQHEHLRRHVREFVILDVRVGSDKRARGADGRPLPPRALYVDARTGILRVTKPVRAR